MVIVPPTETSACDGASGSAGATAVGASSATDGVVTSSTATAAASAAVESSSEMAARVSGVSASASPTRAAIDVGVLLSAPASSSAARQRALMASSSSSFIRNLVMRPRLALRERSCIRIIGRKAIGMRSSPSSASAGSTMMAESLPPVAA